MKRVYDLSELSWTVAGYTPTSWAMGRSMELGFFATPEVAPVPAAVPGSVQQALRQAGLLPDWNHGLDFRACEWVENRDWCFATVLPAAWLEQEGRITLRCLGLDACGFIYFNGDRILEFHNGFHPHEVELPRTAAGKGGNRLEIIFTVPPRWNGTPNFSSRIKDWKARFNYTWDWIPRTVQIGIWDRIELRVRAGAELGEIRPQASILSDGSRPCLRISGAPVDSDACKIRLRLEAADGTLIRAEERPAHDLNEGILWHDLAVEPWQPNGNGLQPLYTLACTLVDAETDAEHDRDVRRVGFRSIAWKPCKNAPPKADPWICEINGRPTFLRGVNWTPIRPNYADVTPEMYRARLELYRDAGFNLLRVWGGAFLEKRWFYDLCDEFGLLVWQEFPLSSSGPDNSPPSDEDSLREMERIGRSYVRRRRHHASLLMWCGGNELQTQADGAPGCGVPLTSAHPMLGLLERIVGEEDGERRYMATSASGPTFVANPADFGKGLNWDVHGPWRRPDENPDKAREYWRKDDALFRSETGHPSASSAELLRKYHGELADGPVSMENPLWQVTFQWLERRQFEAEMGRAPRDLEEYVQWTQKNQAEALVAAAEACLKRFPAIGGYLIWMGHDSWPCAANTSIIDFDGNPKPALAALKDIIW
ncbi:MAG: glycoside hydrolase family 2 TIM barrel-domain containing protein [bacterium]